MSRRAFLLFGLTFTVLLWLLNGTSVGTTLAARGLDLWQTGHAPHPDIVLIAIDNASIETLGRWPWSRSIHTALMDKLALAQPAAVGIDITFTEVEDPAVDARLAASLTAINAPVILVAQPVYLAGQVRPDRLLRPIPALREVPNVRVGQIAVDLDGDGVARRLPGPLGVDGVTYQPLGALLAETLNAALPSGETVIDFAGPATSFPTYSAAAVLDGRVDPSVFADRIILIGATASDLRDTVLAPTRPAVMAGVEWNANVADNLLLGRAKTSLSLATNWLIGGLIIIGAWWLFTRRPAGAAWWALGVLAITLPLTSFILWRLGWAFPYTPSLLLVGGLASYHGIWRWAAAEADKRRLRAAFTPYFAPQVMEAIVRNPDAVKLGGERRVVTVFFSDIRNFTTITESLPPERLTKLLQEYFEAMTEEVFATEGVLSEYVGDGIVAFWGAPMEQPDHANRAVTTARRMFARLKELRPKWQAAGYPDIDIGVGINTGEAIVGNTGSSRRFDYAAIGDTTNAASRLEGLNKEYKTHIIMAEATRAALTIAVPSRLVGDVHVKGKTKPIRIYEVSVEDI